MKKFLIVALTLATLMFMPLTVDARGHWDAETCSGCGGSGTISEWVDYGDEYSGYEDVTCPGCGGSGYIDVYIED